MRWLEHKIPPPVVDLAAAGLMWGIANWLPGPQLPTAVRLWGALALAGLGVFIALAGVIHFARAKTTVNPLRPERASALVTGGVFRFSRNPMYLGMALVLLGWAVALSSAASLLALAAAVWYLDRFQIQPEERVLRAHFGEAFEAYCRRTRRWV
jgi:protein-S-isoprenylcysteine O-methyltransferase Ste14